MPSKTWTAPQEERLTLLWGDDLSASQCAAALNTEFRLALTRSSVIGKVHRLNLPPREIDRRKPSAVDVTARRPKRHFSFGAGRAVAAAPGVVPIRPSIAGPDYADAPVTFAGLCDRHCRWPFGDPKKPGFHFCGGRKVFGLSYCQRHFERSRA